jgi:DNA-binding CsgD family transcriptional regulator
MSYDSRLLVNAPPREDERPSGVSSRLDDGSDGLAMQSVDRARAEVARAVREASQADVGLVAMLGRTSDGVRVVDFRVDADPDEERRFGDALACHPLVDRELVAFPSAWKSAFVSRATARRTRPEQARDRQATDPLGARIPVVDWVGLWVCAGRQLVGWVGSLRTRDARPFATSAVRGLARLVPQVSASVLEAHALFDRAYGERGDAFLAPTGEVQCASARGYRWLSLASNERSLSTEVRGMHAAGRERLERPIRGGTARLVRMTGQGAEGYLAELLPPSLVEHVATSDLTPAQLRVAALAAHGASAQQIALAIGSTEGTVRVHLRDVFRRLGVASRLELARVLGP